MKNDPVGMTSARRLTFREEFLELYRRSPRAIFVLLIAIGLALLANSGIASLGGFLVAIMVFTAVLLAMLVLPAVVGAVTGRLIGNSAGWLRARIPRQ